MRDDDWVFEFEKLATPRFKMLFEKGLNGMPKEIIDKLEALRQAELKLIERKPK